MYVNSSSRLYREINLEEIHTIQSKHFGAQRILSAKPLTGGLFNTTYLLELSDGTAVVLRLGPVNKHLLLPFEHHLMAASARGAELFHQNGVPTAKVIAYDETLNNLYLSQGALALELMGRGMAWLDTGTPEGILKASVFIEAIQSRQGYYIACIEEIAWRKGFISSEQLFCLGKEMQSTNYGQYILSLVSDKW